MDMHTQSTRWFTTSSHCVMFKFVCIVHNTKGSSVYIHEHACCNTALYTCATDTNQNIIQNMYMYMYSSVFCAYKDACIC